MKLYFRTPIGPFGDGGFTLGILYSPSAPFHSGINTPNMLTIGFGLFDMTIMWGG